MSQPRSHTTVAQTNHATDNAWLEVKPAGKGSANDCRLFCTSTEDFIVSLIPGAAAAAGVANTAADDLRDADNFLVDGVAGVAFDFNSGVSESIWVKKAAAAATAQSILCLY